MRDRVVPAADVITPNHFELDFLSGRETRTIADVLDAVDAVRATGPRTVLVTSVLTDDTPEDSVDVVAVSDEGAWSSRTPLLPITPNGCGDVTAAVFLAHLLRTGSAETALQRVTSSVFGILERTIEAGTREIQLVAAQDVIAHPPERFTPVRLR
jgi:pyridoxine kinase